MTHPPYEERDKRIEELCAHICRRAEVMRTFADGLDKVADPYWKVAEEDATVEEMLVADLRSLLSEVEGLRTEVEGLLASRATAQDGPRQAETDTLGINVELLAALKGVVKIADRRTVEFDRAHAAIAKAEERS